MTSNTITNSCKSKVFPFKSYGKNKICDNKAELNLKDNSRNIVVGSIGNLISDFSEETIISFLLANNFKIVKNSKAEKKIKHYQSNL